MVMEITKGYFADIRLDNLRVAGVFKWLGAVHDGGRAWLSIMDKNPTKEQAESLFKILGG